MAAAPAASMPSSADAPGLCRSIVADIAIAIPRNGAPYRNTVAMLVSRSICITFFHTNTVSTRPDAGSVQLVARARGTGILRSFFAARRASACAAAS